MTATHPHLSRRLASVAILLGLSGCASLFVSPPPKYLFRLTPKSTWPPNLPHRTAQLLIDLPLTAPGLDNKRIALTRSPILIDYFADAEWTDRVPVLVKTALLTSFENSGGITALDRESLGLRADYILAAEIRHFEAEYRGAANGPPNVWVAIDVKLVRMLGRKVIAQQLFEAHVPAGANDLPAIVTAFDTALGRVLKAIVLWALSHPLTAPRD
ncbi:MAG TPA: ABC-type transport auxiliary lipoprotein family protein [Stellaceae bacterium]|jgi:cholesterol transport system auxiliary component|nr:ABC-type transport auxiliary lipoprotein family protein [Stellaceae bacterium]